MPHAYLNIFPASKIATFLQPVAWNEGQDIDMGKLDVTRQPNSNENVHLSFNKMKMNIYY